MLSAGTGPGLHPTPESDFLDLGPLWSTSGSSTRPREQRRQWPGICRSRPGVGRSRAWGPKAAELEQQAGRRLPACQPARLPAASSHVVASPGGTETRADLASKSLIGFEDPSASPGLDLAKLSAPPTSQRPQSPARPDLPGRHGDPARLQAGPPGCGGGPLSPLLGFCSPLAPFGDFC